MNFSLTQRTQKCAKFKPLTPTHVQDPTRPSLGSHGLNCSGFTCHVFIRCGFHCRFDCCGAQSCKRQQSSLVCRKDPYGDPQGVLPGGYSQRDPPRGSTTGMPLRGQRLQALAQCDHGLGRSEQVLAGLGRSSQVLAGLGRSCHGLVGSW